MPWKVKNILPFSHNGGLPVHLWVYIHNNRQTTKCTNYLQYTGSVCLWHWNKSTLAFISLLSLKYLVKIIQHGKFSGLKLALSYFSIANKPSSFSKTYSRYIQKDSTRQRSWLLVSNNPYVDIRVQVLYHKNGNQFSIVHKIHTHIYM